MKSLKFFFQIMMICPFCATKIEESRAFLDHISSCLNSNSHKLQVGFKIPIQTPKYTPFPIESFPITAEYQELWEEFNSQERINESDSDDLLEEFSEEEEEEEEEIKNNTNQSVPSINTTSPPDPKEDVKKNLPTGSSKSCIQNQFKVAVLCLDNGCYLRSAEDGRVFADLPREDAARLNQDIVFIVKTKDSCKFMLKSLVYGKYIFKKETFVIDGDYIQASRRTSQKGPAKYLHTMKTPDNLVFLGGSIFDKNRFLILPAGIL